MAGTSVFSSFSPILFFLLTISCVPDLETEPPPQTTQSFGEKFFTIICQRVAYSSSVQRGQLLQKPVDVSGSKYRLACHYGDQWLPKEASEEDPKVAYLVQHRATLVESLNRLFPEKELSNVQDYLTALLPLTDNDTFPNLIRQTSQFMLSIVDDPQFNQSMALWDTRLGYRPQEVAMGIAREIARYPNLSSLAKSLFDFIGEGGKGHQAFMDLAEVISLELQSYKAVQSPPHPIHPADPDRTIQVALDFLLEHDATFKTPGPLLQIVKRDWRGMATVSLDNKTQAVPAPFVDNNKDGLADIDTLGRFITSNAEAQAPQPFYFGNAKKDSAPKRDQTGRATNQKGETIFDYINLSDTLISALLQNGAAIFDPAKRIGPKLLAGSKVLMGSRKPTRRTYGEESIQYNGFATVDAALLDISFAALQLLHDPNILDTLDTLKALLLKNEDLLARLVDNIRRIKQISEQSNYASAKLAPQSTLFDDLMTVFKQIAARDNGALLEDLLRAVARPQVVSLAGMMADYFRFKDVHVLDNQSQKIINPVYKMPVDRTQPDSGANRSIHQRLLHIIHSTNGMKWCNKPDACIGLTLLGQDLCLARFKECELFEIENGALFYMQSIARTLDEQGNPSTTPKAYLRLKVENMPGWMKAIVNTVGVDATLEMMSGIKGLTSHPTPEAINRLMFLDPLPETLQKALDPAVDIDGERVSAHHPGSLLSWEVAHPQYPCSAQEPCHFYDAMRPIIQAFANHDAEKLFLDLLSVFHRHWASAKSNSHQFVDPKKPNYVKGSALVTYEPLLAEILEKTDILATLSALSQALIDIKLKGGQPAVGKFARSIAFLIDSQSGVDLTFRPYVTSITASDFKKFPDLFVATEQKKIAKCGTSSLGVEVFCKAGDTCMDANLSICIRTNKYSSAGNRLATSISPLDIVAEAVSNYRKAVDRAKSKDEKAFTYWNEALSDLDDIFLEVTGTGESMRFKNRSLPAMAMIFVDEIEKRIKVHCSFGDLSSWLSKDLPLTLEEALTNPLTARLIDFFRLLESEHVLDRQICELGTFLMDEKNSNVAFRSSVAVFADFIQILQDDNNLAPILRAIGQALHPQTGILIPAMKFFKPALALDSRDMVLRTVQNAYQEQSPGKTVLQTMLDMLTEVHRVKPGIGKAYDERDFQEALNQTREFIADQEDGLLKLFKIMKDRCAGPCNTQ